MEEQIGTITIADGMVWIGESNFQIHSENGMGFIVPENWAPGDYPVYLTTDEQGNPQSIRIQFA